MHHLLVGDCRKTLRTLPDNHFHAAITSPPYYRQRNYHHSRQVGQENTPSAYVEQLVEILRDVRRTLRPDGTFWLNVGDSYANKNLIGIPWLLAFALRADGWYLRSDVIWAKPNGTPESVKDRPSRCHEYVFLLTKTRRYYYDKWAVLEPNLDKKPSGRKAAILAAGGRNTNLRNGGAWAANKEVRGGFVTYNPRGRNKRSVWNVATASFRPSRVGITDVDHFALFPPGLVRPCILAGTSAAGCCPTCGSPWRRHLGEDPHDPAADVWLPGCQCESPNSEAATVPCRVLDPFAGSCTTGVVCIEQDRTFTGCELNSEYARLGRARLEDAQAKKLALGNAIPQQEVRHAS